MFNFVAAVGAFEDLNIKNKSTAFLEIAIMLIVSFLLGFLLHWLLCHYRKHVVASAPTPARKPVPVAASLNKPTRKDNLQLVEGIGPKIEELLNEAGITTFAALAAATPQSVKGILNAAGPRFTMHDPTSWVQQAALARDGRMEELERLKARLTAGR